MNTSPFKAITTTLPILALLLLTACAQTLSTDTKDATAPTKELLAAELDGLLVDADWLEARLDHPDIVVLHIGNDPDAFAESLIPGQIFLPFELIVLGDFQNGFALPDPDTLQTVFADHGVDDDKSIILTGDLNGLMATRAFFSLEALGRRTGVALLQGGLTEWRDQDRPTSSIPTKPQPGTFTITPAAPIVVDADFVASILEDPSHPLVDARPEQEYRGQVAGPGVVRPGHIPGAINIFWKSTLNQDDRPLLKPVDEIASIYADHGIAEDATLIAYCRTGLQASFGYFLARLQDRNVLLYDGSYVDWSHHLDLPITGPPPEELTDEDPAI